MATRSMQRAASSASEICAALLLASSVWILLIALPIAMRLRVGPDLALLCGFAAAAALVVARCPRARQRISRRAFGLFALGALAGFAGHRAALAAGAGWLPQLAPSGAPRPALWVAAVLVAPIFEELLYRERLLGAFQAAIGAIPAVVLSSLLFAASHVEAPLVLAAFAAGVGLGSARLVTGSIALCIGAHAGLNAASLARGFPVSRSVSLVAGPSALIACLAIGAAAGAGEVQWSGTLAIDFLSPGLPRVAIPGSGVATVNGGAGNFPLISLKLAGGITGTATLPVTDPEVAASIPSVRVAATLGTGSLRPFWPDAPPSGSQLSDRALLVRGAARLCLFISSGCYSALEVPFSAAGGLKGIGVGGLWTAGGFAPQRFSILAAPWTVRSASATVTTASGRTLGIPAAGWAHGALSFSVSAALEGGAISLVTPIRVTSNDGLHVPAFGRLTLRFIPEPGRLSLLGAGLSGLLCLGRSRIRSSSRPGRR